MATVTAEPRTEASNHFLLENVRWQTYLMLLEDLENRHIRLTYDHGRLEIMAPAFRHESFSFLLSQVIVVLAEELQVSCIGAGSTTFKREDQARGLEPDHCFYFKNYRMIVGKTELDLAVDPPPDLAIEVDITRSVLNRMSIYASLGVPEIWRCRESGLEVYLLNEIGEYQLSEESSIFPGVSIKEMVSFIYQHHAADLLTFLRSVRAWVRKKILPAWKDQRDGK
jgi:Uma2 family endonuclease